MRVHEISLPIKLFYVDQVFIIEKNIILNETVCIVLSYRIYIILCFYQYIIHAYYVLLILFNFDINNKVHAGSCLNPNTKTGEITNFNPECYCICSNITINNTNNYSH